jgi:hypothetical protein
MLVMLGAIAMTFSGCEDVSHRNANPPSPIIATPVVSEGTTATITIARRKQFCMMAVRYQFQIDGHLIAALWRGEHTQLQIPAGEHSLTVSWTIGNLYIPFISIVETYSTTVAQNFDAGREYRVLSSGKCFDFHEERRVMLEIVDSWPPEVILDPKTFVAPSGETANGVASPK